MRTTSKVAAAAATVLLALTACSDASDPAEEVEEAGPTATATAPTAPEDGPPAMPEPALDGLPDVIVEIDGVEITREEFTTVYEGQFQQAVMQAQMTGEEIDQDALKQRTAEGMVDTELLLVEAADRSIAPTEEEVTAMAEEVAAANGMSADELFAALEEDGLDRETARSELASQTALEQLFADEAGELSLTEEELRERYDAVAEQAGPEAELPAFEDARPALEAELQREHENTAVQGLVERLRENAEITYHW